MHISKVSHQEPAAHQTRNKWVVMTGSNHAPAPGLECIVRTSLSPPWPSVTVRMSGQNYPAQTAPLHLYSPKPSLRRLSAFLILPKNMCRKQGKFETYKRLSYGIIKWMPPHEGLTLMHIFLNIICITTWHECLKSSSFSPLSSFCISPSPSGLLWLEFCVHV